MKYKVMRDCLDFSQHLRKKGEIVTLDAEDLVVPLHFLLLDGQEPEGEVQEKEPEVEVIVEDLEMVELTDSLKLMDKKQLVKEAWDREILVTTRMTKARIISMIVEDVKKSMQEGG